jgi:hypothetical protein
MRRVCLWLLSDFIQENKPVQVGIFRENRNLGIGEMHSYLISIRDITDRLRTAEGTIRFASLGGH